MGKPPSVQDFEDSIWILRLIQHEIVVALELYEPIGKRATKAEVMAEWTIKNRLLILLSSFLEEWPRLRPPNDAAKLTRRLAKPFVDRVARWSDLPRMRNRLAAHPYRDAGNEGKPVTPWEAVNDLDAPYTPPEIMLLGWCAIDAISVVVARHQRDLANAKARLEHGRRRLQPKGVKTQGDAEDDLSAARLKLRLAERQEGLPVTRFRGPPYKFT